MTTVANPQWITTTEFGQIIGLSPKSVRRMIYKGQIPQDCLIKIGSHLRVDREAALDVLRAAAANS